MARKPAEPGVDRRQQILEAALAVFAERGFEAATNKEIARQADVNQGLIYFYFESKADLFFAAFEHHARDVVAQLDALFARRHSEDPATGLAQILAEVSELLAVVRTVNLMRLTFQIQSSQSPDVAQHPERLRALGMLVKQLSAHIQAYLEAQIAAGALRAVNAELVATIITRTLISSVGARGPADGAPATQAEFVEALTGLFCYGLLPRAG